MKKLAIFFPRQAGIITMLNLALALCLIGCKEHDNRTVSPQNPISSETIVNDEGTRIVAQLRNFEVASLEHTTDSLVAPKKARYLPQSPRAFDAGRFSILFVKGQERRTVICNTEESAGHYAKIEPGKTMLKGHLSSTDANGSEVTFSRAAMESFVEMIYMRFARPISKEESLLLDQVKDMCLAVLFGDRGGVEAYHTKMSENVEREWKAAPKP